MFMLISSMVTTSSRLLGCLSFSSGSHSCRRDFRWWMVGTNKHCGVLQHIPTIPPTVPTTIQSCYSQTAEMSCVNKGIIGTGEFYLLRLQTMGDLRRHKRQEIETQNIQLGVIFTNYPYLSITNYCDICYLCCMLELIQFNTNEQTSIGTV